MPRPAICPPQTRERESGAGGEGASPGQGRETVDCLALVLRPKGGSPPVLSLSGSSVGQARRVLTESTVQMLIGKPLTETPRDNA